MDEPSHDRKIGTVIVMVAAVVIVALLTLAHLGDAFKIAGSGDLAGALGAATGTVLAYSFIGWLITLAVLVLVQKQWSIWGGRIFFPILLGSVVAVNAAVLGLLHFYYDTGDNAVLKQELSGFQQQVSGQSAKFQTELLTLGYPEFLHPASLGAPGGLERAQTKIAKAREILKTYRERNHAVILQVRTRITTLAIGQAAKGKALADFNAGLNTTYADGERIWTLLDTTMAQQQAMLDDLAKAQGHWKTDADKLLFQRQIDLDRYNRHAQAAQQAATEAVAIAKRLKENRATAAKP